MRCCCLCPSEGHVHSSEKIFFGTEILFWQCGKTICKLKWKKKFDEKRGAQKMSPHLFKTRLFENIIKIAVDHFFIS
jgi:hypothetical protein